MWIYTKIPNLHFPEIAWEKREGARSLNESEWKMTRLKRSRKISPSSKIQGVQRVHCTIFLIADCMTPKNKRASRSLNCRTSPHHTRCTTDLKHCVYYSRPIFRIRATLRGYFNNVFKFQRIKRREPIKPSLAQRRNDEHTAATFCAASPAWSWRALPAPQAQRSPPLCSSLRKLNYRSATIVR